MYRKLTIIVCLISVVYSEEFEVEVYDTDTRTATAGEVGYQLSIEEKDPASKRTQHACAGAAIDKSWALTTGFCVLPMKKSPARIKDFQVVAGKLKMSTRDAKEQVRQIVTVFTHDKYPPANVSLISLYDIGLIKLDKPLDINKEVQLVPLPAQNEEIGNKVQVSGWNSIRSRNMDKVGLLEYLNIQNLDILDQKICEASIPKNLIAEANEPIDSLICSGPKYVQYPVCIGDTGGPMVKPKKFFGSIKIIGILSYAVQITAKTGGEGPTVFIKVSKFLPWINEVMSKK